jgi:hypothetical protein
VEIKEVTALEPLGDTAELLGAHFVKPVALNPGTLGQVGPAVHQRERVVASTSSSSEMSSFNLRGLAPSGPTY